MTTRGKTGNYLQYLNVRHTENVCHCEPWDAVLILFYIHKRLYCQDQMTEIYLKRHGNKCKLGQHETDSDWLTQLITTKINFKIHRYRYYIMKCGQSHKVIYLKTSDFNFVTIRYVSALDYKTTEHVALLLLSIL